MVTPSMPVAAQAVGTTKFDYMDGQGGHLSTTTTESPDLIARWTKISQQALSVWDHFVLLLCVAVVVVATFIGSCRVSQGVRAFFLANRSFRFLPIALSMMMSNIGSTNFVGAAGAASRSGLSVYAYELNSVVALLALGWIFMPVYIASGSMTTLDYLKKRYGGKRIELYLALVFIFLIIFSKTAVELYSLHKLLVMVFGSIPYVVACSVPLVWAGLITYSGGLQAVMYSNTVQAVMLMVGAFYVARNSLASFESYDNLRDSYFKAWPNTTVLHFGGRNDSYRYTNCGLPKAQSWNIIRDYFNLELPWPGMVFGLTINSLWIFCCDQQIVQNGLGGRNLVHVKYACVVFGYIKILTILFMVLPGIVARVLYTDLVACADPQICENACGSRHGCSETAFPTLFLDVVPPGSRGIVLAAMIAASISSLSASLNSGSTIFTLNIYRNLRPVASEMEIFLVTRSAVVAIAVASLFAVPIVQQSTLLYDYMHNLEASFAPPIVAVFLCGMLWERASEESAFRALILGLVLAACRLLWHLPYSAEYCGDEPEWPAPQILSNFHFLHFAIFLFVLCSVYIALAGVFSEPINVVHLYRLLYWLRHSKLDRVDLNELDEAYQQMKTEQQALNDPEKAETVVSELTEGEDSVDKLAKLRKDSENTTASQKGSSESARAWRLCGPCTDTAMLLCCIRDDMGAVVTNNELRETAKQRADIRETPKEETLLNTHAVLLLLVSAVLWGYLA